MMNQGSIDALVGAVLSPLRLVLERASVALLLLSTLSALVWASLGPAPWLQWPASLALLWACLGICWINRNHHQEKRKIIEGMLVPEQARWLSSAKGMSWPVLLLAHILLLCALVLTLRLLAGAAGTAIFKPAPSSLQMWALYTFDLLCKAALFDIPEVYKIEFTQIKHVGFFGGSLVLLLRLIILALVVGAVMQWRELCELVQRTVSTAQQDEALSRQRLSAVISYYPGQVKRLCDWAHHDKWRQKPACRAAILEVIGESEQVRVLPVLIAGLSEQEAPEIRIAALRGLATYGSGPLEKVKQVTYEELAGEEPDSRCHEAACETLAAWGDEESLSFLKQIAAAHPHAALRLAGIQALGQAKEGRGHEHLAEIMFSGRRPKEERFGAKDAILALGEIASPLRVTMTHTLLNNKRPDSRRFAGMILGGVPSLDDLEPLSLALTKEQDPHSKVYVIEAIASLPALVREDPEHLKGLCQSLIDMKLFSRLLGLIEMEKKDVSTMAAIRSLPSLLEAWSVAGTADFEAPSAGIISHHLDLLISYAEPQFADLAMDAQKELPKTTGQLPRDEAPTRVDRSFAMQFAASLSSAAPALSPLPSMAPPLPTYGLVEDDWEDDEDWSGPIPIPLSLIEGDICPPKPAAEPSWTSRQEHGECDDYRDDCSTIMSPDFFEVASSMREASAPEAPQAPVWVNALEHDDCEEYRSCAYTCAGVAYYEVASSAERAPQVPPSKPVENEPPDYFYPPAKRLDVPMSPPKIEPLYPIPVQRSLTPSTSAPASGAWSRLPHWIKSRYRWLGTVYVGQLATVYKVYDRVSSCDKALKVANDSTPLHVGALVHEAEVLLTCESPGLLPLVDSYVLSKVPAFTTPWIPSPTLFQQMAARHQGGEKWSLPEVKEIVFQLSDTLDVMHEKGWFHGDLKPENVFYGEDVLLYDCNAAHRIDEVGVGFAAPKSLQGTPYYMSPEQVHKKPLDQRVDVYSLGILTYELLAGALPLGMEPLPLSSLRDDVPFGVDMVLKAATATRACDRFVSPEAFRLALSSALPTEE